MTHLAEKPGEPEQTLTFWPVARCDSGKGKNSKWCGSLVKKIAKNEIRQYCFFNLPRTSSKNQARGF